ncbi:adenylate/guanylate cyclase domain-containing protein [Hoeflea poritis]|uniref:Adenylate/guanylate cyclase domain-containing protein n=1 Tax=Hoeflea poritis TaxID=2993659 RepID=A0ABT4VKL9_9HYPH|nr:adenylate/guanylate cyclase domain-containing protein [Hoeflea poritis]MDA4845263.1 adenylate/guanylate cyclase domain-containing protein [Hoeflea poritis]
MTATGPRIERKLTTILAADAAGYASAMDADEVGTLSSLRAARGIFSRFIDRHNGRIANTAGDGLIAEFPSVVEAVQCAIEVQRELGADDNASGLRFRIGVHLGDVMVDGDDLLGEGVNLAARLEAMAEPGGVLVSQQVYDQVHSKLSVGFQYLGERRPKNFSEDVPVYCVSFADERQSGRFGRHGHGPAHEARPDTPKRPHREAEHKENADTGELRGRVMRHAKTLGIVWIGLLAIDLATGGGFWAQWPGVVMLALIGIEAAPLFAGGRYGVYVARLAVLVAALALINLFSWSGTLWVVWPAGALIVAEVVRRIHARA